MPLLDARAAPEGNRQLHIIMWDLSCFSCFSLLTFFHCWFFTAGLLTFFDAPAALLLFLFFFPTTILFFFAMLMQH